MIRDVDLDQSKAGKKADDALDIAERNPGFGRGQLHELGERRRAHRLPRSGRTNAFPQKSG
jgi:hypothetical protein